MLKKILILLMYNAIYSQTNEGVITYLLYNNFTEEKLSKVNTFSSYYQKAIDNSGTVSYILLFNKDKTLFKREYNDLIEIDIFSNYYTNIFFDIKSNCFNFNQPKSVIYIKEKYKIIKCDTTNWKIENESKLIDNKLCYKALKTDYTYSKGKKKHEDIVAWFCPEIPLKFGPLEYNGLPGLIMELTIDNETTYIVNKIEYKKIEKLENIDGTEIEYENYEKYRDSILQEKRKSIKN